MLYLFLANMCQMVYYKDKLSVKEYEDPFGEDKAVRKPNKDKQVVNDR